MAQSPCRGSKKDQMKIAVIGDSVADSGNRNSISMIVDIGDSVAMIESQHQNEPMQGVNAKLHIDKQLWLLCGRG